MGFPRKNWSVWMVRSHGFAFTISSDVHSCAYWPRSFLLSVFLSFTFNFLDVFLPGFAIIFIFKKKLFFFYIWRWFGFICMWFHIILINAVDLLHEFVHASVKFDFMFTSDLFGSRETWGKSSRNLQFNRLEPQTVDWVSRVGFWLLPKLS